MMESQNWEVCGILTYPIPFLLPLLFSRLENQEFYKIMRAVKTSNLAATGGGEGEGEFGAP